PLGVLIAKQIREQESSGDNIWDIVDTVFEAPETVLADTLAKKITPIMKQTWKSMPEERKNLFRLLSRMSLSIDQAKVLFIESDRKKQRINCTDRDIIENPYIIYEQSRLKQETLYISVKKIDRAVFPVSTIDERYPVEEPSRLTSDNDERRIRAIAISVLECEAENGSTIMPCNNLSDAMRNLTLKPECAVTPDILRAVEKYMLPEIMKREMKDGTEYYKLVRIQEFDDIIERRISRRMNAPRLTLNANWREFLDSKFNEVDSETGEIEAISEQEERARQEKAAILDELAQSRISVLVGDAGTGKTTVLSVLCSHPEIKAGGVLLLAPTGKATVRLLESMGEEGKDFTALNVAQFLVRSKRFDFSDMRYILSEKEYADVPDTVIIDESSMLTEEMFGALMQSLKRAKRIIFVGDPNQLPPIGPGRPFVDLVYMVRMNLKTNFPRVCEHYGELTVNRRQKANDVRMDVRLSRLFTGTEERPDDDVITEIVRAGNPNIEFVQWSTREELEEKLLNVMAREVGMSDCEDQEGFDRSLGAVFGEYGTFYNIGAAEKAERWQILAPVRNMPQGVMNINRLIHLKYREKYLEVSKRWGARKRIANCLGPEGIVYGDKVINVINTSMKEAWPKDDSARNYIANGEIGIACGDYSKRDNKNNYMHVEFSSQPGYKYSFDKNDFDDEKGTAQLELAYALTVHKAQGSQFGTVILVLGEPCQIISRELLYTALTRQLNRIIILYNKEPYHLLNYSTDANSDIAARFTDLFADIFKDEGPDLRPQIVEVNGKFYEEKMIHKTVRGELVRSKSEVIIANALHYNGLDYEYEPELKLEDRVKRPDFKVEDYDTGIVWYWEHCGMMSDPQYKKRWQDKKKFYEKNGIVEGKNLIVTYDDENGGLDSDLIQKIIEDTFGLD
ncbi:MAG: AAA family ATPase, partial [Lachnospiraceae bacterium]|nr:AAA family ATPase [Lachnospiraceae bacterium]